MLRRLGRSRATSEDGFSLLEVVVALALFMIMSASLGYALTRVLHTSRSNESRVIAANLAERKLETLRSMNPLDIALGAHPRETVTIENRDYFLDVRASYNTVGEYQNACEGASGKASFTAVHIEVSWSKMDGVQPIRSDTTFALPVTGVTATTGVLTIPVEDAAGEPVQNMPVTLTGPTGSAMTATTMSDGCAVFTNVAPSTGYTASVNSRGWVDKSGKRVSERTGLSVIAGEVSKAAGFVYDKAATVRMRLTRADAAGPEYVFPPQTGVTLANGSGGFGAIGHPVCPDGSPNCVTVDAGERERTGLFPFTDGYETWTGTCSTAHPAVSSPVVPKPGQSATIANAKAAALRFQVVEAATAAPATGWSITIRNEDCAGEVYDLGYSTTEPVSLSLPPGKWRLEATDGARTEFTRVNLAENQLLLDGAIVAVNV